MRSTPVVVAAIALLAAIAGAVVGAVLGLLGAPVVLAAVFAGAAALALALWLRLTAARYSLRALGSAPAVAGAHPRLENLVQGLCTTHGFQVPQVHTVETDAVNAASVGLGRPRDHLVLTRGAMVGLDRLELEAVVARQLCQIRSGTDTATLLASIARLPGAKRLAAALVGRVLHRQSSTGIDLEAVRLTGYPPALASALKKSEAAPKMVDVSVAAHLWMVIPPSGAGGASLQPATAERLDVLGEV